MDHNVRFDAVLTDLDNTLIDYQRFKEMTASAAAELLVSMGLPATKEELIRRIFEIYDKYGWEQQKTFFHLLAPFNLELNRAEMLQQATILEYNYAKLFALTTFPDVMPTLLALKEMENGDGEPLKLGIVTDAPRNKAWQRLLLANLAHMPGEPAKPLFDTVVTKDDAGWEKPHRFPFRMAMRNLGLKKPSRVLFVGDNLDRDMVGANGMRMKTAHAAYGQVIVPKNPRVKPHFELAGFKDVLEIVKGKRI